MGPIASFSGLASGIQWRDMIEQIMHLESSRRLTPVSTRIRTRQSEKAEWTRYRDLLNTFLSAARKLGDGTALGALTASAAKSPTTSRELVSAQTSAGAQPGTYGVEVVSLAAAHKVRGTSFADAGAQLGVAGEFHLNGRRVVVAATDSLTAIRDKINLAGAGVTATILSADAGSHQLVLTAGSTGSRGIELVEGTEGVLASLGVVTASTVANRSADGATAQTQRFTDASSAVGTLLGGTMPGSTTIDVNGTKVSIDLAADSLTAIRDRIVGAGGSASLVTETVDGVAMTRLAVTGTVSADAAATDPAASQRAIELLGFERRSFASEVVAGADAKLTVDGVAVERRQNTVTDVVEGLTLTLLAAEPGTTVDVTVTRDHDATTKEVEALVKAFNEATQFVKGQRDSKGPLQASGALRSIMFGLRSELTSQVTGLSAGNPYDRAALVGITFDRNGVLSLDTARFKDLLATDFASVDEMMRGLGAALEANTEPVVDPLDGDIARQLESLDLSLASLQSRETSVRAALDRQREAMAEQFVRMEQMLARAQAQSGWLLSQFQNQGSR